MERCDECGFEYDLGLASTAGAAVVATASQIASYLGGEVDAHLRPEPDVWSPLEYACHVRDVLLVQRERILLARRVERPSLEPMGRDVRVEHDGYSDQAPSDVARQLEDAALMFANVLSRLGDDWDRTLMYNYPQLTERSLRWTAVHTLHELRHHLLDVERQLAGDG